MTTTGPNEGAEQMDMMVTVSVASTSKITERDVEAFDEKIPPRHGAALGIAERSLEVTLTGEGADVASAIKDAVAAVQAAIPYGWRWHVTGVQAEEYEPDVAHAG